MKRSIVLAVLVCTAAVGLFAGGGREASSGGGGKKTIEFWHIQNTEPAPTFIGNAVRRFEAANPDYKVNITVTANDSYKQKIAVAIASGQVPDVFMSWTGGTTNEYVKAGLLADLTPYFNAGNYKARFLDAGIAQAMVNGKIYGFPCENAAIEGVWYNKELFAKYNIKVPTTIAELEAACDTLKANGITPFSLANMTKWTGMMYYQILPARHGGLTPFANALSGTGSFEDPAFIWAAEKIQSWVRKGYFNDGFNGLDEDSGQSRTLLYTGQVAMHIQGSWFASNMQGENPAFISKTGFFNFPADETGTGNPRTVTGTIGDNFYHVSSRAANPEKAFEMLTYLLDEQSVQDRVAAGRIPPLKNVAVTDPLVKQVFDAILAAPDVQLWYDQSLTPEVADVMLSASQELFGLSITPQQFTKRWADAQRAALK
ncbi:MAG: extracellular solute-binding protein [Spirochaetaceae bacterium]|jgi:raffinose/stachyose/melibiose transport system substrate-binding protein|nr:extracellular solute-binding protein [Spirochaetaceae bacterium]